MSPPVQEPCYRSFWKITSTREVPELGPGPRRGVLPRRELEARLDVWATEQELDPDAATRLRASALLYHDHHDAAHDIVQDLNDVEGALIHGILHRREPDYWNAKYWLRRAEAHPIYVALGRRLPQLVLNAEQQALAKQLTLPGAFEPLAFVDLCEETERRPALDPSVVWLRQVQHAEFEELVRFLVED
ncbi:MAG TPA: hypothetical protein PLX89_21055 [Verrucomicrobiota bacterium]|nr:hypothetical protein [Verrucomicrobiota bacterium]